MTLDELRKKPKHVRAQYAFFSAVGVTSVIGLVWLVSLSVRMDMSPVIQESQTKQSGAFSQFYDGLKGNLANSISALKITAQSETPTNTASTPAATSTASSTSVEGEPVFQWSANQETATDTEVTATPRTILIGTSSAKTASGTSSEL